MRGVRVSTCRCWGCCPRRPSRIFLVQIAPFRVQEQRPRDALVGTPPQQQGAAVRAACGSTAIPATIPNLALSSNLAPLRVPSHARLLLEHAERVAGDELRSFALIYTPCLCCSRSAGGPRFCQAPAPGRQTPALQPVPMPLLRRLCRLRSSLSSHQQRQRSQLPMQPRKRVARLTTGECGSVRGAGAGLPCFVPFFLCSNLVI